MCRRNTDRNAKSAQYPLSCAQCLTLLHSVRMDRGASPGPTRPDEVFAPGSTGTYPAGQNSLAQQTLSAAHRACCACERHQQHLLPAAVSSPWLSHPPAALSSPWLHARIALAPSSVPCAGASAAHHKAYRPGGLWHLHHRARAGGVGAVRWVVGGWQSHLHAAMDWGGGGGSHVQVTSVHVFVESAVVREVQSAMHLLHSS
jgi:hypothetical protein